MDIADIPLFSMLRGRLGYLSERQRLIAENVANTDTPNFKPRDLKPFSFQAQVLAATATSASNGQAVSQAGHMQMPTGGRSGSAATKSFKTRDSETTLDGNSVVLEEEMIKMTEARMSYETAIGFYQKSLSMLRLATRAPGRGG